MSRDEGNALQSRQFGSFITHTESRELSQQTNLFLGGPCCLPGRGGGFLSQLNGNSSGGGLCGEGGRAPGIAIDLIDLTYCDITLEEELTGNKKQAEAQNR